MNHIRVGMMVCPEDEEVCPECSSEDIGRHHQHECAAGEYWWWECESCQHVWGVA